MNYPDIDPVAISLGPFQVHWYGLMYVIGFVGAWWLGRKRAARIGLTHEDISDLLFYLAIGVVVGGRLGYALFYGLGQWAADPLWVFRVWDGGMSFHGGLIGVLLAALWFARKKGLAFFTLTDFFAPMVPIGLGADTNLPVGVQLQAPQFRDENMFRAAAALEQVYGKAPIAPAFAQKAGE